MISAFNRKKGFNASVNKAVLKAREEENFNVDIRNRNILAFTTYVVMRTYFRFFNNFTRDIAFRRGVVKFILYSLGMFTPSDCKSLFREIETELINDS